MKFKKFLLSLIALVMVSTLMACLGEERDHSRTINRSLRAPGLGTC